MNNKQAALIKLATVRMAINHVLRMRGMQKQAFGNPFGLVNVPDAVGLYNQGVKSVLPYTKPGQVLLGGWDGAVDGGLGPFLYGNNWQKTAPRVPIYSSGITPLGASVSSVVAPLVAQGVYGSADMGEGFIKEYRDRREADKH